MLRKKRQSIVDKQIKQNLMWDAGAHESKDNNQVALSGGLGLALLSKALGVQKIEDKFQKHIDNIKKTKVMTKLELRRKLQRKIRDDIGRLTHQSDLEVAKMYWKSKKSVYGIDNELNLVEQVQRCMKGIFIDKIIQKTKITHQDIVNIFDPEFDEENEEVESESSNEEDI